MNRVAKQTGFLAVVREVMVDFGFGQFFEMFETKFGPWPTKMLLAIIGLTVVVLCVNVLVLQGIIPVFKLVSSWDFNSLREFAEEQLVTSIFSVAVVFIFGFVLSNAAMRIVGRAYFVKLDQATSMAAEQMKQAVEMVEIAEKHQARAHDLIQRADQVAAMIEEKYIHDKNDK